MSTKERASLGFGEELEEFDPAAWTKGKASPANNKPKPAETKKAAEATGFRSREPARAEPEPALKPRQRRRRTGRNAQLNIKTKQEAIDAFTRIADANGWGFGEAFERALELLERKQKASKA